MKIVIGGGSGFIGRSLCAELITNKHDVTVLSRNPLHARQHLPEKVSIAEWDGLSWGALEKIFGGADALINLMGEPIADARWTNAKKEKVWNSRIDNTRMVVNSLSRLPVTIRPHVLINSSGIGYYGMNPDSCVDESSPRGTGFLADLCVEWEREAMKASDYGIRVVCLRTGMVLGLTGGALPKMLFPFKVFLGGPIGPGDQHISWIHIDDMTKLIAYALEKKNLSGPVNAVTPHPVSMREFSKTLGKVLGRPSWLPVPAFALKFGLGEMSTLMTHGQWVKPTAAQKQGFSYDYPFLEHALQAILKKPC